MKYFFLFALILLAFHIPTSSGQDSSPGNNSILISPFALVSGKYTKIRIRFQHSIKSHFILGADLKYYFPKKYPGYQVAPFLKYFFRTNDANGFYYYITGVYGKNKNLPDNYPTYYDCYGGGFGLGYQVVFGQKESGLIDFAFGLKSVSTKANLSIRNTPDGYLDYFTIGAAAFFDGILAIGVRF